MKVVGGPHKNSPGADLAGANATPTIFDLLISHGARLADSDALHLAAGELEKRPGRVEMMAHVLDLAFDINAMARRDYPPGRRIGRGTPLHAAFLTQETDRVNFFVQRGANLEIRSTLGRTPLEYPVAKGFANSETVLRSVEEAFRRNAVASAGDTTT